MHLFINEQSVEWHGLLACFVGFEKAFSDSVNMQEHLVKNIGGSWSPFKIEEDSKVDALREQLCCSVEQDLLQRSCLFSVASDADAALLSLVTNYPEYKVLRAQGNQNKSSVKNTCQSEYAIQDIDDKYNFPCWLCPFKTLCRLSWEISGQITLPYFKAGLI